MSTISVKNLSKTYVYHQKQAGMRGSFFDLFKREKLYAHAVQEIRFEIGKGELVGFLGPNGAGKTTTLKMLSGILYPSSGDATVLGFTPWQRKRPYLKEISLVMGQKAQLWWDLPSRESFLFTQAIYDIPDREFKHRMRELGDMLEVTQLLDVPVRNLSLGERMKMELVNALLHYPAVLFLDEPTIGLDVVAQKVIRDFLKAYNETYQTTILLTSHYMEDVEALCKRVIVITNGRIVYDGLLDTLLQRYVQHKILKLTFLTSVERAELEVFGEVIAFEGIKAELKVPRNKTATVAQALLGRFSVDDILIDEVGVDAVVREIFKEHDSV